MKTIKQMLITVAVLLCSATASAHEFEVDGIYYNIISTEDKTVEVTYRGDSYDSYENEYIGEVVIPSSVIYKGHTYSVTSINYRAFSDCDYLTSITIPNSVTSIGDHAFYSCDNLTSITIPNSVTRIGGWAFKFCSNIKKIVCNATTPPTANFETFTGINKEECVLMVPEGTEALYKEAYLWKDFIEIEEIPMEDNIRYKATSDNTVEVISSTGKYSGKIVIPETVIYEGENYSVTSIGDSAFYDCFGLTSITIPEGVTSIGKSAFRDCDGLTSITIPSSVTSISDETFCGCSSLTSVVLPEGITCLGWNAFNSSGLTSITIPGSVTTVGASAFWNCSKLTSVTIQEGLEKIEMNAFGKCSSLGSINIPESVTTIGDNAFWWCKSLTSVTIPESVTSIGVYAFHGCTSLPSISIPSKVTRIGDNTFDTCSSLTSVSIPSGVTSIGDYAFVNCSSLKSISIPSSVTSIGNGAFNGCDSLTSCTQEVSINGLYFQLDYLASTAAVIPNPSGAGYEGAVTIPETVNQGGKEYSVTSIGDSAFYDCSGLTSITIPEGVTSIGKSAFRDCDGLNSITIPNSVTSIGEAAFSFCSSLTSITIPESVTSIGDWAFENCSGLISITIPKGVTSIGYAAFWGCSGLTSITIPNSVTSIGWYAFQSCSGLTSITIPNSVTSIGDAAFSDCYGLTSITIPEGVTSIGYEAFLDCSGLTSITIPNSVTSIGSYAFNGCSSLESVYSQMKTPCAYPGDFGGSPVLYIPSGTRDLYIEQGWDDWASEIVEMKISSTLAVADVKVTHGASVILPVSMENEESITAFQFEVSLPEGVSLVGCELTDRKSDQTLSFTELPSGNYQVVAISLTSKAFKDSEGALVNLQLATEKEMEAGEYNVTVKNIELTTTDEDALRPANCTAKLTVTDVMVGDSNGDGKISITDAVAIVNYILNKPSSSFAVKAADVNMDAKVTITDAVAIVNKILAGTTEAKSRAADIQLDPQ